mgnify:CR=1 FL=1
MFDWLKRDAQKSYSPPEQDAEITRLCKSITDNMIAIRTKTCNSADLLSKELSVCGLRLELLTIEGMCDAGNLCKLLLDPLMALELDEKTPDGFLKWARGALLGSEQREIHTLDELFPAIMSGFAAILIDGADTGLVLGVQGFDFRAVGEPSSSVNVKGSREGFVEVIRVNMSMLRRRIKSPSLVFELMQIGNRSKTDVCIAYMSGIVSDELLRRIRERLARVNIDVLLDAGYLKPFLDAKRPSMFDGVGSTERPDIVCAKLREGRVAVLVDGTPFALIAPFLFSEHFQTLDDYSQRPLFVFFMRLLRYFSFFISMLLPGIYVAVVTFHPELLPEALLFNISTAEEGSPFSLMAEAFAIHVIYEIMREAGLRLPRPVGHAVGIVGALVVGDAAVSAGIVSAPMVMIVALTALSALVVPTLYESATLLKFAFIIFGGLWGIYGVTLLFAAVLLDIFSVNVYGVPTGAPISPTGLYGWRDVFLRVSWRSLSRRNLRVQDVPGSELDDRRV